MSVSILKIIRRSLLGLAIVLFINPLQAQTTGMTRWVGASSLWSSYRSGTSQWNVYTSPYKAQFKIPTNPNPAIMPPAGTVSFGPTWDIFCVDFRHYANTNTTTGYATNFTNLGTNSADIGIKTRAGNSLQKYLQAAWLSSEIAGSSADSIGDINGAIWQIMSGQPAERKNSSNVWTAVGINSWIAASLAKWNTVNAKDWVVVTDVNAAGQSSYDNNSRGGQEYITHVTPEPVTLLLLGTGLLVTLMAVGITRRSVV